MLQGLIKVLQTVGEERIEKFISSIAGMYSNVLARRSWSVTDESRLSGRPATDNGDKTLHTTHCAGRTALLAEHAVIQVCPA